MAAIRSLRTMVAYPSDIEYEVDSLADVVDELNSIHGPEVGYQIELLDWKTHSAPGLGRPQALVTQDLGDYDVFVGLMWSRLGTPTGVADSGTVEEFNRAYQFWQKDNTRPVLFYFCTKPVMPSTVEQAEQLLKVLQFKEEVRGKGLEWAYATPEVFPGLIRKHLAKRVKGLCEARETGSSSRVAVDANAVRTLKQLLPLMSEELQRAFYLAHNENRLGGDAGVKTQTLFEALLRVAGETLAPVVEAMPEGALPEPTSGIAVETPHILDEMPWLSHCVASSVKRLASQLPEGETLTALDVFIDIARNGTGSSVRQLREHGVGVEEINSILAAKGISVVSD